MPVMSAFFIESFSLRCVLYHILSGPTPINASYQKLKTYRKQGVARKRV